MKALAAVLAAAVAWSATPSAQPLDSLATASGATASERTPRGAVTRALLLPGLGQVYNRQPFKAPVAAAIVAGSVVFAVSRQQTYLDLRRATIYADCQTELGGDPDSTPARVELCTEAPDYVDEWEELGMRTFAQLKPVRDRARGQRDVGVLVVAVAYAAQALDAYVAAQLADFDVSPDVALGPRPTAGVRLRVRL